MKTFTEVLYADHGQTFSIDSVLHEGRTAHQHVLIFENETFGRVLALDGVVQITERDNHIYHEMLTHVPLLTHGDAKDVLIIGGGDGGVLRETLRHPVRTVTLVELDEKIIDLSRKYFPDVCGDAFRDARISVVIADGATFIRKTSNKFDVIIIDSTDPIGPGQALFTPDFYVKCRSALRKGGILCVQSGAPFYRPVQLIRLIRTLRSTFGNAAPFLAPVPTYAHGSLALVVAGDVLTFKPARRLLHKRWTNLVGGTRYYSADVHRAAFAVVPTFASEAITENGCSRWSADRLPAQESVPATTTFNSPHTNNARCSGG